MPQPWRHPGRRESESKTLRAQRYVQPLSRKGAVGHRKTRACRLAVSRRRPLRRPPAALWDSRSASRWPFACPRVSRTPREPGSALHPLAVWVQKTLRSAEFAQFVQDRSSHIAALPSIGSLAISLRQIVAHATTKSKNVVRSDDSCCHGVRQEGVLALSENLERPNKGARFREEAVRLHSGECATTNSRKS